jgi:hypothetical protein
VLVPLNRLRFNPMTLTMPVLLKATPKKAVPEQLKVPVLLRAWAPLKLCTNPAPTALKVPLLLMTPTALPTPKER